MKVASNGQTEKRHAMTRRRAETQNRNEERHARTAYKEKRKRLTRDARRDDKRQAERNGAHTKVGSLCPTTSNENGTQNETPRRDA